MKTEDNNIKDKGYRTCTGCGVCEIACPFNAIKITLNKNGFYSPSVFNEKCTHCGICKKVCYKYAELDSTNNNLLNNNLKTYSGYSSNTNIRLKSSSGGVSHEIGRNNIEKGKRVIGARYSYTKNIVEHSIADNEDALYEFIGSKYLQSYTPETFKNIKSGDVIFGTPCQIFGLRKLNDLKGNKDLLFVDLYCHGIPSYHLWDKHITNIIKKHKIGKIQHINFREKEKTGWHNYSIVIKGENNTYRRMYKKDSFFKMFLFNQGLNHACYNCEFRRNYFPADIRIGDFWGKKYSKDENGITIITANLKGQKQLNSIQQQINLKEENITQLKDSQNKGNIKIPLHYQKNISGITRMNNATLFYKFFLIPFLKKAMKKPKIMLKLVVPEKIISYLKA